MQGESGGSRDVALLPLNALGATNSAGSKGMVVWVRVGEELCLDREVRCHIEPENEMKSCGVVVSAVAGRLSLYFSPLSSVIQPRNWGRTWITNLLIYGIL
jgi:hypothetical protein